MENEKVVVVVDIVVGAVCVSWVCGGAGEHPVGVGREQRFVSD